MTNTQTIAFSFTEPIYCLHPEASATATYVGRAQVTIENQMRTSETVSVEFTHLWFGIDVPTDWQPHHFREATLPDNSQGFAKLRSALEGAAIDQFYSPTAITLPDEERQPIEMGILTPHELFGKYKDHFLV